MDLKIENGGRDLIANTTEVKEVPQSARRKRYAISRAGKEKEPQPQAVKMT